MGNINFRNATFQNNSVHDDPTDEDIANTTFINDIWIVKPTSYIVIMTSIFLPVVLFGVFGNILSIYVLIKNKHICTPTNVLIGNMAVADLLSLMVHPWVILTYDIFQNYQLGSFGCKTEGALECAILLASVISVSAISYDRLTAILLPRETRLTKNGVKIIIASSWIAGFIISTPVFVYRTYKERQWLDFLEKYCTENALIIHIYWHVIITALVWLPLTIQLICYISIYVKLNKYEKVVLRKLDHRHVNYKKKAVRMMLSIIFSFLICRLPYTALIFYRVQHLSTKSSSSTTIQNSADGEFHTLWYVAKFLIFLNSALNPLIYSICNEKFQRGFKTTLLSKWLFPPEKHKPSPNILKQNQKSIETTPSLLKKSIFFIFKKKHKSSPTPTNQTVETSEGKNYIPTVYTKKI